MDSRRAEKLLGEGTHGQAILEGRVLPKADLADLLRAGDHAGFLRQGDTLFVFSKLEALDWYLVVELDASDTLDPSTG